MCKPIIIIGAGGHGRVLADAARCAGRPVLGFLDDQAQAVQIFNLPLLGRTADAENWSEQCEFLIGIGANAVREQFDDKSDLCWATVVHPSAQIGSETKIGPGSVVLANAVINCRATIGRHCIVNSAAVIEHDCVVGNYVHVSPHATLCGTVTVGEKSWIGAGATIKNNVCICQDCIVGLGASVVKSINVPGRYVGIPARKLED